MPDASPSPETAATRVMIFIDFWNYELTMKELDPAFLTNWFQLPPAIMQEVARLLEPQSVQYERCFVVGSYDPASKGESRLRAWADTVLSRVTGVNTMFSPRQKRTRGPKCTGPEHHEVAVCPQCGASMLGTQEKGVDTHIVTEMLDVAFSGRCDAIVLVSADKDFIPAVQKLMNRNIKVIHAFFPNHGNELAKNCWGNFNLFSVRDVYRRTMKPTA